MRVLTVLCCIFCSLSLSLSLSLSPQCAFLQPSERMQPSVAGGLQESPQSQGERGELSQLPSRDAATAETSEPGCARPVTFDLLNMVVSYKRIAIYLEPMKDGVEVVRYLLG